MLCTEIDKLYLGEFVLLEGIVKQLSDLLLFYNAEFSYMDVWSGMLQYTDKSLSLHP